MNKIGLLKNLKSASQGNFFSIEIPKNTKEDEKAIDEFVGELVRDGKIKLRECIQRESSVYLHGIIKYASE
jgi:hypothetical protein